ncbi:MAG TPA: type II secretion system protein GspM [Methylomirabilota bacterium]|nr:type II secretion system protein GspM [Methylomirabilota bacterium]
MRALRARERTIVLLGLFALLATSGYVLVVEPALARQREMEALIPAREATLESRRRLVAQRDRLTFEGEALGQQIDQASIGLLPGPTPPLAASALQRLMKDIATGSGVELRSERVLAPQDLSGVFEIPIELTVAGNIRQVVTLLARLERAPGALSVKDLKIRVAAPGQPRELLASMVVAGYLRPGTLAPAEPPRPPRGDET